MSAPPFMPLYVADYLGDTGHLTTTEHGAYFLLLMTMWRAGGSLPNDDKKLARFCRCTRLQWDRMRPTILEFFEASDDALTHRRMNAELTKYTYAVERQRVRSSNGGKAKALKTKERPLPRNVPTVCQPEPEPEDRDKLLRSIIPICREVAPILLHEEQSDRIDDEPVSQEIEDKRATAEAMLASLGIRRKRV